VFALHAVCFAAAKKLKRTGSQKKKNAKKFGRFVWVLFTVYFVIVIISSVASTTELNLH